MKTREQIYGQEAAGILRDVSMYRALTEMQLLKLYPHKESKIRNLLSYLQKQGRIVQRGEYYRIPADAEESIDHGLSKAVWVLTDFMEQVEYHSISDYPAKIIFFADGEVYEIIYAEPGKEQLINQMLSTVKEVPPKYIVLIEQPEQIAEIHTPNTSGYCTVSSGGEVQYYQIRSFFLNRAIISQRITSILAEIERLNNALYAMNTTDIQRYPDNYEVLSTDAALRAERITCRLRHLIYATTSIKKEEYLRSAETMQGIEISENDGILEIKLPCLLPKRRQRQSTEFLLDPFTSALSDYAAHHTMPQFQHCVVCFSHIYAQELPERRIRDYDNLELKQFLDVAASFILTDDNGLLCDAYNTTELGEEDCTRLFLMDSTQFPAWLAERQNGVKSISDF